MSSCRGRLFLSHMHESLVYTWLTTITCTHEILGDVYILNDTNIYIVMSTEETFRYFGLFL